MDFLHQPNTGDLLSILKHKLTKAKLRNSRLNRIMEREKYMGAAGSKIVTLGRCGAW